MQPKVHWFNHFFKPEAVACTSEAKYGFSWSKGTKRHFTSHTSVSILVPRLLVCSVSCTQKKGAGKMYWWAKSGISMSPSHSAALLSYSSHKNWWTREGMAQPLITSVSSLGLPSLLHLGLSKQSHPIPGALTPAITLLYLKQSSLFKIKGRNMDQLLSFAFLPPLEGATRAHLWDAAITWVPKFGPRHARSAYL